MVWYTRRRYRRRRYYRRKRASAKYSKVYNALRVRVDIPVRFEWGTEQEPMDLNFKDTEGGFHRGLSAYDVMKLSARWLELKKAFQKFKILGMAVEATPEEKKARPEFPAVVALVKGVSESWASYDYKDLCDMNTSMLLDPNEKRRIYVRAYDLWRNIQDDPVGGETIGIQVRGKDREKNNAATCWQGKISVYVRVFGMNF